MAYQFITIPAGTPARPCRGAACGRPIYLVRVPMSGRAHPVSAEGAGGLAPTRTVDGIGTSHFIDCPNAADFNGGTR